MLAGDSLPPLSSPELPPPAGGTTAAAEPEAPAQPGVAIAPRYYRNSEIDQRADPVELAPLIYPADAFMRRLPGVVSLRVFLNEHGDIDSVDVIDARPPGIFEKAAVDAVLNTRFAPARLFGRPVKNVKTLEVRFDPFRDQAPGAAPAGKP